MRHILSAGICSLVLSTAACAQADVAAAAAAKEAGASVTSSGLVYRALKEGTGASPAASDTVKVHYRGSFPDGREFDSSYKRNEPTEFPLNRVIPCWTEGVQKMKVGGKAKLTCPAAIAYGSRGAGGVIPPNATLQFEIELLEVKK
ncbi:MAG TPA: FKBP-type peptidyl-prolyl cis-trans isomerase [Polaromonas sp.]|uniref:FKBP-type peptidyl-prolyl cis-trans isomerase n=1 Tax=Polaromonas sp. TaxID=1869339 RepID=UPI002D67377E|nr:FKBP-type peptidyl-prolyl cis-trans isomerase [Polaromonas sp.]HYW58417.1 FKBP-type peptidyl-prolyl cis-trans isomerase [Polaromonas sp.]